MEDKIIEWSTAILAQQCGFEINREACEGYFYDGYGKLAHPKNKSAFAEKLYLHEQEAPTQSLLCKWLRDKHNIHIVIEVALNNMFSVTITPVDFLKVGTVIKLNKVFTAYESALEEGIKAALTYIKQKNNES